MKTRHPAFWRYTAFQIPGWLFAAVGGWWIYTTLDVPLWLASGVLVVWVIKDYALYPVLRFAYEADHVRVRGELWRARAEHDLAPEMVTPGSKVTITAVEGTTLLVDAKERGDRAPT